VVTSSRTPELLLRGAGFDPAGFDAVVDQTRATRGKPDPELYRLGVAAAGVPAAECWVVEDAPAGVAAGKAAGCTVVALARGHAPEALAGADLVVRDFAEIPWPPGRADPARTDPG
jgi:mannitol-1-/sugar-/sorbitol-6-phosphatase